MARIRSIKPEFWQDERLAMLPMQVRMLFIGLLTMSDDDGRFRANPLFVRAQVFPYDLDVDVAKGLEALHHAGRIQLYATNGERYGWVVNFRKHQRIDKPKPSALPEPPPLDLSKMNLGTIPDESKEEGKGVEGKGMDWKGVEPPPPTLEERIQTSKAKTEPGPVVYEKPDSPAETWGAEDFYAWAQWKRQEAGLLGERVRPPDLGRWYSACLMTLGGSVEALQDAFYRFGENKHWQKADPPLPFRAFVKQWEQFVPRGAVANVGA